MNQASASLFPTAIVYPQMKAARANPVANIGNIQTEWKAISLILVQQLQKRENKSVGEN